MFKNPLGLSIVCSKCGHDYKRTLKEEELIKILNILGLITSIREYQKRYNMTEVNISQEFRLKNIDEAKHYFTEEINQNKLMSKKHQKVCIVLNYIEHLLI